MGLTPPGRGRRQRRRCGPGSRAIPGSLTPTPPTATISGALVSSVTSFRATVTYTVTANDAQTFNPAPGTYNDFTLDTTGSATGTCPSPIPATPRTVTVTVGGSSGSGTLGFTLNAGAIVGLGRQYQCFRRCQFNVHGHCCRRSCLRSISPLRPRIHHASSCDLRGDVQSNRSPVSRPPTSKW